MPLKQHRALLAVSALVALICPATSFANTGKLLLTGGVSSIDGAAGGGLTPWAVIGSNATDGEIGATAHLARTVVKDYAMTNYGAAVGYKNKVELSIATQDFDAGPTSALATFGVTPGTHLKMDIIGAKAKLAGNAVLDSDTLMPQVAVGVEYKRLRAGTMGPVIQTLGGKLSGIDLYVSATKLFLAQGVLVNGTVRVTKANQNGLLGFGGALGEDKYRLMPEISVAYLVSKNIAIGAEYRFKPNNLEKVGNSVFGANSGALREDDWKDIFIAYAPTKTVSLTAAYVDLGRIAPALVANRKQTGIYMSAQLAY